MGVVGTKSTSTEYSKSKRDPPQALRKTLMHYNLATVDVAKMRKLP
jgi:hypothetical protein